MKKGLLIVLGIIFILVVFLVVWSFTFGNGGILFKTYDAFVGVINTFWNSLTGSGDLLPTSGGITNTETGDGGLPTNPFGD